MPKGITNTNQLLALTQSMEVTVLPYYACRFFIVNSKKVQVVIMC